MTPIQRAFRGAKNDWRLHLLSVFSVAVAFVCLTATLLAVVNVDRVRERWASLGRASVYLRREASTEQVDVIEKALKSSEGVVGVRRVSSEDARREVAGAAGDPLLEALPADAFPASLEVSVQSGMASERVAKLAAQLEALPAVESVETYGSWSERLGAVLAGGVTASLLLGLVVLAAVISVVSSTIRLSLQRRRIEVEVLKLVGATDSYVRRPFVFEGAVQGAVGALLAVLLLGIVFVVVQSNVDRQLVALLGQRPVFLPVSMAAGTVLLGGCLGAVAAFVSLRKFLSA
ncbi:MAG TPA: permease-like cell division protein FtsX [Polyangiaceae bacterium]|nr:permease-like cell division protein FtsX [Polyangiaceae bacterium]